MKSGFWFTVAVGTSALAIALGGCTVTVQDTSDAAADSGTVSETGAPADTGTTPTDTGSTDTYTADTGTTDTYTDDTGTTVDSTTADTSSWVSPPDPAAYYARFVVATSDFTDGSDFDVCYLPWDGTTPASDADVYTGPIAAALGGSFSAPEVTNYYSIALDSAHRHMRIRLVAKGSDCTKASKFHIFKDGADRIVSIDDPTATFQVGYNTAIVFGNVSASTSYHLLSVADPDPTGAATVPTLQFFNGYNGGLKLTLTGTDGTKYVLSSGASIPFKAYVSLPFTTGSASGTVDIKEISFDNGSGTPVVIGLTDFAFSTGYYWAFSYGNSTDGLKFYLCGDSLKVASTGDVALSGCKILP